MNGIKKKKLEIELAKIPPHPDPKVEWEQYTTPSPVAADILFTSYIKGDILNKTIIDLGCGTGIFSVGAATIGAKKVIGIDIDDKSITLAKEIAKKFELSNKIEFEVQDINRTNVTGDTVIMNPPFGAQKKGADLPFLKKAFQISQKIYSLHNAKTEDFLRRFIQENGFNIDEEKRYMLGVDKIFKFHKKEKKEFEVILFIMDKD